MAKEVKDTTAVVRQRALIERNAKRGLVKASLWVPAHRADELKALVAQWRAEFKLEGK